MGRSTSANVTAVPGHDAILLSDNKMMCQCGAQFMGKQLKNNKSNHKRHLKSLNGDFECEHCGRDFTREDNLQSHIRKKHS